MKLLYKLIFVFLFLLSYPLFINSITTEESMFPFRQKELKALILVNDHMYRNQGHTVGFHYDLLDRFAEKEHCKTSIFPIKQDSPWQDLVDGNVDIVVIDASRDSIPEIFRPSLISSIDLNEYGHVWIVRKKDMDMLMLMNRWMGCYKISGQYDKLVSDYFRKYRTGYIETEVSRLSPYDDIIKKYADSAGWDWRLLASLIYQESQFSIVAKSDKQARGLMQIRPVTAEQFDIENIYDPDQNLKAGTSMLIRLGNLYRMEEMDFLNRIKFVLAAYNAGEGRIEDVRKYAEYRGVNNCDWEEVAGIIPEMRHIENLNDSIVKFGIFNGTETINYVEQVISRYENYCEYVR